MEAKLFWKSVIRRKGSLLLLLVLIAASTFGFTLRAIEYLTVSQEIARISQEYRTIGSLSAEDWTVTEGIPLVMESPYVELADINRFCPVVLSDVYNADLDGHASNPETEHGKEIGVSELMTWGTVTLASNTEQPNVRLYYLRIEEGVYGYPEYIEPGTVLRMEFEYPEDGAGPMPVMEQNKSYLVKAYLNPKGNTFEESKGKLDIHMRMSEEGAGRKLSVCILPLEEGVWFLEGEPDEGIAQQYLGEDFELQERNRHAMVAISTKDMTAMPLVQEASRDFYLKEGRWITKEDYDQGNRVCLVSKEFADVRELSLGDSLTMTFQDRRCIWDGYATPQEDTWESGGRTEETLEIVGIYGRMYGGLAGNMSAAGSINYLYVPDSCIPEHYAEEDEVDGLGFSFMLSDPRKKNLFLAEMEEKLGILGISISFVENNWDNFYQSARSVEQGGLYSLAVFAVLLVLALAAVVFLYTWQRRKECAVARALGVPAKRGAFCACLPLTALSVPGILAGGILAWQYGRGKAGETLASLGAEGTAGLPWYWFAGILLLVWLVLALALLTGGLSQAGKQVLEVLQEKDSGKPKKAVPGRGGYPAEGVRTDSVAVEERETYLEVGETAVPAELRQYSQTASARGMPLGAALSFISRHLCHFSLRSLFALLAGVGFLCASCWLWGVIQSGEREAERLYLSTPVEVEITKKNTAMTGSGSGAFIGQKAVQDILETGFVEDCTLIAGGEGTVCKRDGDEVQKRTATLKGIGDAEECLPKIGMDIELQYYEGYGPEVFGLEYVASEEAGQGVNAKVIFLPDWMAEELGADPGEQLRLENKKGNFGIAVVVGGVYITESGRSGEVFVPLSLLQALGKGSLIYLKAEFTLNPAKNRELEEFRQRGREIVEVPDAGLLPMSLVIWDNELEQAIEPMERNIALMKLLYPLANGVALLAAIGLSILFLSQRRREAAILRVMGVGAMPTRLVLSLELLAADLAGLLLGALLAALLMGADGLEALPVAAGSYFLGCLVGIIAGAMLATRGRPLELLQDKE